MATNPPQPQPGPATGRPEIVTAALAVYALADNKKYKWGGHTTDGFDCSGFVIYTLKQAYPNGSWTFITAGQIFADRRLEVVTDPRPGDLIGFRKGPGVGFDHIGIVLDADTWIGSQSSTGVEKVALRSGYWAAKPHFFLRLK